MLPSLYSQMVELHNAQLSGKDALEADYHSDTDFAANVTVQKLLFGKISGAFCRLLRIALTFCLGATESAAVELKRFKLCEEQLNSVLPRNIVTLFTLYRKDQLNPKAARSAPSWYA